VSHESIDAWTVDKNGFIEFNQHVGPGWVGWNPIDGQALAAPTSIAAVSRFDGHLEVWVLRDGFIWGNTLINGTWQGWYPLRWSFVA
jgi:hypothetical protein